MDESQIRRRQRFLFIIGLVVAAIPVVAQVGAALLVQLSPDGDFPNHDKSLYTATFWIVQVTLLTVATCGNTVANYFRVGMGSAIRDGSVALRTLLMAVILFLLSYVIAMSLLNSLHVGYWLTAVASLGIINMFLSYRVEMDLALTEAGLR